MRTTDIAIVGGGLAGSTAAAMLGRAGIPTVLIDPHRVYPPDLRCEKLSGAEQIDRFRKTGLADSILQAATHDGENWIARFGTLLCRKPSQQFGMLYDDMVNAIRAEIPAEVGQVHAKVTSISTSAQRQIVVASNGEEISARLVVLANGLNVGLRSKIGIARRITSACHSITLAFDLEPVGRSAFEFRRSPISRNGRATARPTSPCFRSGTGCGRTCSSIARWTTRGYAKCAALPKRR